MIPGEAPNGKSMNIAKTREILQDQLSYDKIMKSCYEPERKHALIIYNNVKKEL